MDRGDVTVTWQHTLQLALTHELSARNQEVLMSSESPSWNFWGGGQAASRKKCVSCFFVRCIEVSLFVWQGIVGFIGFQKIVVARIVALSDARPV